MLWGREPIRPEERVELQYYYVCMYLLEYMHAALLPHSPPGAAAQSLMSPGHHHRRRHYPSTVCPRQLSEGSYGY